MQCGSMLYKVVLTFAYDMESFFTILMIATEHCFPVLLMLYELVLTFDGILFGHFIQ